MKVVVAGARERSDELVGSAVVNLASELVERRPSAANVRLLTTSRVEPTRALVEARHLRAGPVPMWVQASTLAIYGDAGDRVLDESDPVADGPPQMAGVATAWEAPPDRPGVGSHRTPRRTEHVGPGRPSSGTPTSTGRWPTSERVSRLLGNCAGPSPGGRRPGQVLGQSR